MGLSHPDTPTLHSLFIYLCGPGEWPKVQSHIYPLFKEIGPHIRERGGEGAWGIDGMSLLADGLSDQYNTIVFFSLRDSERHGGTYGVIASDEVFIRLY